MSKTRAEKKYESITNGEMKKRWDELSVKYDFKEIKSKEEYEEYKKMEKIYKNSPMVENLIETKKELENLRNAIIEELHHRESIDKENKQIETDKNKIAKELETLMRDEEKIIKDLKNPDLSEEEKGKLNQKLEEIQNKKQLNDSKYLENEAKETKAYDENKILAQMTKKELTNKAVHLKIKMDVCEFYMNRLLKGQDLNQIKQEETTIKWDDNSKEYKKQLKDEVKKYTCSKEQKEKINNLVQILKEESAKKQEKEESEKEENKEKQESLVPVSEFDQKHPKLAAVKNWFKKIIQKVTTKTEKNEKSMSEEEFKNIEKGLEENIENLEKEVHQTEEKSEKQSTTEEYVHSKRNEFMNDLKFFEGVDISKVAESGYEEIKNQQEQKEMKEKQNARTNAMQKLIENKRKAGEGKDGGSIAKLEEKLAAMNGEDKGEDR